MGLSAGRLAAHFRGAANLPNFGRCFKRFAQKWGRQPDRSGDPPIYWPAFSFGCLLVPSLDARRIYEVTSTQTAEC